MEWLKTCGSALDFLLSGSFMEACQPALQEIKSSMLCCLLHHRRRHISNDFITKVSQLEDSLPEEAYTELIAFIFVYTEANSTCSCVYGFFLGPGARS